MSTIKNGQISLYRRFNKITKGPGTSFLCPLLSQNTALVFDQISFWQYLGSKRINKCNFHYVVMLMMTSQILKSVDFTKTQKSRYLENETFLLQIKKFINCASRATLWQKNIFLAEVTFRGQSQSPKREFFHHFFILSYFLMDKH